MLLGQAEAHEPVRRVVAAALRDRPPFEQADVVTSVVSSTGTASTRIGRRSVATVDPATFQLAARPSAASAKPSTCAPESPMKTSALPPGRRLNGRNPAHAHAPASANARSRAIRVDGDGVDREEPERDPGERRREAVHVVEQVERVRHADEPEDRERPRDEVRVDQLDAGTGREHDHGGGDLQRELRFGESACTSSTSPATNRSEIPA